VTTLEHQLGGSTHTGRSRFTSDEVHSLPLGAGDLIDGLSKDFDDPEDADDLFEGLGIALATGGSGVLATIVGVFTHQILAPRLENPFAMQNSWLRLPPTGETGEAAAAEESFEVDVDADLVGEEYTDDLGSLEDDVDWSSIMSETVAGLVADGGVI
jgi:hypothetical protein